MAPVKKKQATERKSDAPARAVSGGKDEKGVMPDRIAMLTMMVRIRAFEMKLGELVKKLARTVTRRIAPHAVERGKRPSG